MSAPTTHFDQQIAKASVRKLKTWLDTTALPDDKAALFVTLNVLHGYILDMEERLEVNASDARVARFYLNKLIEQEGLSNEQP